MCQKTYGKAARNFFDVVYFFRGPITGFSAYSRKSIHPVHNGAKSVLRNQIFTKVKPYFRQNIICTHIGMQLSSRKCGFILHRYFLSNFYTFKTGMFSKYVVIIFRIVQGLGIKTHNECCDKFQF